MRKVVLFSIMMLCCASMVFAQGGVIGTYSDALGNNCNVTDSTPGLLSIFVVHTLTPGATASQWSAPTPLCMVGAVFLSDTAVFPVTIGLSTTGVAIGYGACFGAPLHILSVNYFAAGLTLPCCHYPVIPDPAVPSNQIEVVDCVGNLVFANGVSNTVNGDPTCDCTIPVRESTWGSVKSLYVGE